jgi:hypothetical protein
VELVFCSIGRLRSALGALLLLCFAASVGAPLAIALGQTGECVEKCCTRKKAHACCKRTPRGIQSDKSGCGGSCGLVPFGRLELTSGATPEPLVAAQLDAPEWVETPAAEAPVSHALQYELFERPPPAA